MIRANVRKANDIKSSIFALGSGFDLKFDFLTALSVENGGTSRRIYPGKDATSQREGFFDEISTTLLLQVRFEYPNIFVDDSKVTVSEFSQYYEGSELIVSGKIKEGESSRLMAVNVRGISGSNPVTYTVSRTLHNLTVPSDKVLIEDFPERLWAYMRIKQLLVKLLITDNATERARLKSEVLQMSLQYNFVTPLTSFVVVESESGIVVKNDSPDSNDKSAGLSPSAGWNCSSFGLPLLLIFLSFVQFCVH